MSDRPASSLVCRACGGPIPYYGRRDLQRVVESAYESLSAALREPQVERHLVLEALDAVIGPRWSEQERCTTCFPPVPARVAPADLAFFIERILLPRAGYSSGGLLGINPLPGYHDMHRWLHAHDAEAWRVYASGAMLRLNAQLAAREADAMVQHEHDRFRDFRKERP